MASGCCFHPRFSKSLSLWGLGFRALGTDPTASGKGRQSRPKKLSSAWALGGRARRQGSRDGKKSCLKAKACFRGFLASSTPRVHTPRRTANFAQAASLGLVGRFVVDREARESLLEAASRFNASRSSYFAVMVPSQAPES